MMDESQLLKQKRRERLDSVIHGVLDDSRDLKKLKTADARWAKISQIIGKPTTQLILFEVPRGFNIEKLNNKCGDIKHRLKKAAHKGKYSFEVAGESVKVGIEAITAKDDPSRNFQGAAHIS